MEGSRWLVRRLLVGASLLATSTAPVIAQDEPAAPGSAAGVTRVGSDDPLLEGFRNPPHEARPQTWWHWMNGNVTEDGIKADLEWMRRVGIGGVQQFDAGGVMASYTFIKPRLVVGDENWRSAIRTAAQTADRLGLDLTTATSAGWSLTGGRWVTPEEAMKKYVWSETLIEGGRPFSGILAQPPSTTGPFQNASASSFGGSSSKPHIYRDALVVAYRLPPAGRTPLEPTSVTSSSGQLNVGMLQDGDLEKVQPVVGEEGAKVAWITADFARPVTVRAVSLGIAGRAASDSPDRPKIEVSDDGKAWRPGTTLSGPANAPLKVYSFPALTARHFRFLLPAEPPAPSYTTPARPADPGPVKISISELVFRSEGTVDRFVEKAGFGEPMPYSAVPTVRTSSDAVVRKGDVVDVTRRMAPDGTLVWTPPTGRWRVIRLGYSLTGQENGPTQPEATGLEVDKLNPEHVRAYLDGYLARFARATGSDLIGSKGLHSLVADSWEAGLQNWTERMPAEFERRRGYDMLPWVPVLTGRIVGSASESERFLWDYRRTLQDLLAQHYEVLRDELHKRGMGFYAEAQGDNWRALADGMEIKSRADIPMAEYWFKTFAAGPGQPSLKTDMKEAASVAHIYGKLLAANESLTVASSTPWGYAPSQLKPVVDEIFAYGINRFVLHTSVQQPVIGKRPGLALGPFGQYINRNETWAEQAKPFFDYIARASFLLQQGRYVADVAYFYGEDRPLVSLFKGKYDEAGDRYLVEVPSGNGFDFINSETLLKATTVSGNELATRGGMRYRLLFLGPDATAMTLPMLRRLEALVQQGVVLVGARPRRMLGLGGSQAEFDAIVRRVWGIGRKVRSVGRGKVYGGIPLEQALAAEKIGADVSFLGSQDPNILQLHRRTDDGRDIFFLSNRRDRVERVDVAFRTTGRRPELWDANTGRTTPLGYRIVGNRTIVSLALAKRDSAFVVFRERATQPTLTVRPPQVTPLRTIDGPWALRFAPDLGAPAQITMPALRSWTEDANPGVRYFSGTATYARSIDVPPEWRAGSRRVVIDLGDVRELAQVLINGRDVGIQWKPPYRADITDVLKVGTNTLEVRVTNLWPNRIIGDLQPGVTAKVSWIEYSPLFARNQWNADSPLMSSGLLGPVRIEAEDAAQ